MDVVDHVLDLLNGALNELELVCRPVSYTHLDVYKRQLELCRIRLRLSRERRYALHLQLLDMGKREDARLLRNRNGRLKNEEDDLPSSSA